MSNLVYFVDTKGAEKDYFKRKQKGQIRKKNNLWKIFKKNMSKNKKKEKMSRKRKNKNSTKRKK